MMGRPQVPATLDDIDADWLSAALGFRIQAVERHAPLPGIPMTSQVARLSLRGDGPAGVVIKVARPGHAHPSMYEREVRTYRELEGLPLPHCWYADVELPRFVLVLEDLADAEPGHPLQGASLPEGEALLSAVAGWHRAHWNTEPAWPPRKVIPRGEDHRERVRRGWAGLDRALFPASPQVAAAVDRVVDGMVGAMSDLSASPHTLVHSDIHAENVVFEGLRPVFLDWQNTAIGPAAVDLGGALTCIAPDVLAAHWDTLIEGYLHTLGSARWARADVDLSLRGAVAYGAGAIAWLAEHAEGSARDVPVMQGHWARLSAAIGKLWA